MEIRSVRRKRLHKLMDERFNNDQRSFADAIDRAPNYVSRMLSGKKGFGEELARAIEKKLGLPPCWFDQAESDHSPTEVLVQLPWPFRIDPLRFKRLKKPQQQAIEGVVERMIAAYEADHPARSQKRHAG